MFHLPDHRLVLFLTTQPAHPTWAMLIKLSPGERVYVLYANLPPLKPEYVVAEKVVYYKIRQVFFFICSPQAM